MGRNLLRVSLRSIPTTLLTPAARNSTIHKLNAAAPIADFAILVLAVYVQDSAEFECFRSSKVTEGQYIERTHPSSYGQVTREQHVYSIMVALKRVPKESDACVHSHTVGEGTEHTRATSKVTTSSEMARS
jgi:hypothetical protein